MSASRPDPHASEREAHSTASDQRRSPASERGVELAAIFSEHAAFVWRSLRYLGLRDADVEDAAQEVFMVVHQKLSDYQERARMRSWLYSIAARVARAQRRRVGARRELALAEPPEGVQQAGQLRAVEQAQALRFGQQLVAALPDKEREVFVLFELEQLPMHEVALAVDCPLQTAYARLHKARQRVQAQVTRATKKGELR